ncbi:MAG: PilZ domain-containing protein [Sphingomonas sp.]|nr:PilZ domain-containing protein [Sphingomonas sp.]
MSTGSAADRRNADRDEVHYRAKLFGPDARRHAILIVNASPHGMMARCEQDFAQGDRVRIMLPVVGVAPATIRWSLGGRIGVHFDTAVDLASYYELLATMMKQG